MLPATEYAKRIDEIFERNKHTILELLSKKQNITSK